MKLKELRSLIREELKRTLVESKCPSCGSDGAYIGFNSVECENSKCLHYVKPATSSTPVTAEFKFIPGRGGVLYIDGEFRGMLGDPAIENPYDCYDYMIEQGVTHVIDDEIFYTKEPKPIDDWLKAYDL